MDICSVLTFRESWPVSRSLESDDLYKELRRVDLFDQILCQYYSRLKEGWGIWGGHFRDSTTYRPLFLSVEAEDDAVYDYLLQALQRYTRTDEEDPEADWNKFAKDFAAEVTKVGAFRHPVDYRPIERLLMGRCLAVRGWCSRHEELLRRREKQLQRGKIRALHILDLPTVILEYMFDNFQQQPISGAVDWEQEQHKARDRKFRLETIRSARLVCRAFNKLASPLLCPILHLRIDQQSIDRVQNIVGNPLISAGVRGVRLALSYCPSEIAMDESRFLEIVQREVEDLFSHCCHLFVIDADPWMATHDDHRMVAARNGFETIKEAMAMYREPAWKSALRIGLRFRSVSRYVEALRRGFKGYRDLHDEQARLLRHGVFTSTLASLLASLQRPIALNLFFDDPEGLHYADASGIQGAPETKRTPTVFLNPDSLADWIRKAHSRHFDEDMEFESAKFICELPIALQKEGVLINRFSLNDMTHVRSLAPLDPRMYRPIFGPQTDWTNLFSFGENLKSFELLSLGASSLTDVGEGDIHIVESYLRAMLSNSSLVDVDITLAFLRSYPHRDLYQIRSTIFTSPWPRIRRVCIESFALSEAGLRRFCQNLGDEIGHFFMGNVKITDGDWGDILDILRGKLAARVQLKKCTVRIPSLYGGGTEGYVTSQELGGIAERYVTGEIKGSSWKSIGGGFIFD
ncbi:unnamed protein product [Clonostachys byssicola]|uniref:Uncharacterized protein n=1 Tax=Clonostachys byssicola TaxID=160290 RepID=A0A9N9XXZ1_9HYPO|nr:unnamed protein product [Clonostachys byssicola]